MRETSEIFRKSATTSIADNHHHILVGGDLTILKNMSSSMGRMITYGMENKSHV